LPIWVLNFEPRQRNWNSNLDHKRRGGLGLQLAPSPHSQQGYAENRAPGYEMKKLEVERNGLVIKMGRKVAGSSRMELLP